MTITGPGTTPGGETLTRNQEPRRRKRCDTVTAFNTAATCVTGKSDVNDGLNVNQDVSKQPRSGTSSDQTYKRRRLAEPARGKRKPTQSGIRKYLTAAVSHGHPPGSQDPGGGNC